MRRIRSKKWDNFLNCPANHEEKQRDNLKNCPTKEFASSIAWRGFWFEES
jgi:hypothetical protein